MESTNPGVNLLWEAQTIQDKGQILAAPIFLSARLAQSAAPAPKFGTYEHF